jgi:hypothetical protein
MHRGSVGLRRVTAVTAAAAAAAALFAANGENWGKDQGQRGGGGCGLLAISWAETGRTHISIQPSPFVGLVLLGL